VAKIIRSSELIIPELLPVDTGRASKPEGSNRGGGVEGPPSHQTYFDTWYGRYVLVFPQDGKIWRFFNRRAKRL